MVTEATGNTQESQNKIKTHIVLALFIALVFAALIFPNQAQAQIVGRMEADIPFQFYAGSKELPPGRYDIRRVEATDLTVMEISSADGSTSALFMIQAEQAHSRPDKSVLIFNRYGNVYFLAQMFAEGESTGSQLVKSRYEKLVSQGAMPAVAQVILPANRRAQQGTSGH
jgi:hypothetical protein